MIIVLICIIFMALFVEYNIGKDVGYQNGKDCGYTYGYNRAKLDELDVNDTLLLSIIGNEYDQGNYI